VGIDDEIGPFFFYLLHEEVHDADSGICQDVPELEIGGGLIDGTGIFSAETWRVSPEPGTMTVPWPESRGIVADDVKSIFGYLRYDRHQGLIDTDGRKAKKKTFRHI
jgi:hypothetical protein